MNFDFWESAKEKILIVAHRGTFGGNIPCNTLAGYEIALKQGADVLEIDVEMSADGKLYIFHPGMEPHHLCHMERIRNMTSEEISRLRYVNYDRTYTQFGVNTFDEFLEAFKGRCYVNVDKFWGHPKEIYEAIKRHGMTEQMIVKSTPSEKVFSVLEEVAPELPYMPIVRNTHPMHEQLVNSKLNYVGAEVLFEQEDAEVASPAFIEKMHRDGKLVWVNSIIYNYKEQLAAGHSDDTALCTDPDLGWGWLAKRGFDFIQTDWTGMLLNYLKENDLLYKKK
ncbi:MAG: glycerophosphodiester phosphodiesterase family protein [Clostridia bacterium]|nr:glycerophosphodiester phosphodiesterase family protein [Clostridia bacterium]